MRTQARTRRNRETAEKFSGRQHPSARPLEPAQAEHAVGRGHEQTVFIATKNGPGGASTLSTDGRSVIETIRQTQLHGLAIKVDHAGWPREKAIDPRRELRRRLGETKDAIHFFQTAAKRRGSMILSRERQRTRREERKGARDERHTGGGKFSLDIERRFERGNTHALHVGQRSRIEFPYDTHQGHAGFAFAARDRGLDRRRPPIFGEERRVEIQRAEPWRRDKGLPQNVAVRHHEGNVGLKRSELRADVVG